MLNQALQSVSSGLSNLVILFMLWDRWSPTEKVPCPQQNYISVVVRLLTHTGAQHVLHAS